MSECVYECVGCGHLFRAATFASISTRRTGEVFISHTVIGLKLWFCEREETVLFSEERNEIKLQLLPCVEVCVHLWWQQNEWTVCHTVRDTLIEQNVMRARKTVMCVCVRALAAGHSDMQMRVVSRWNECVVRCLFVCATSPGPTPSAPKSHSAVFR